MRRTNGSCGLPCVCVLTVKLFLAPLMNTEMGEDQAAGVDISVCVHYRSVRLVRTGAVNFAGYSFNIRPLVFSCCDQN